MIINKTTSGQRLRDVCASYLIFRLPSYSISTSRRWSWLWLLASVLLSLSTSLTSLWPASAAIVRSLNVPAFDPISWIFQPIRWQWPSRAGTRQLSVSLAGTDNRKSIMWHVLGKDRHYYLSSLKTLTRNKWPPNLNLCDKEFTLPSPERTPS